MSDLNNQKDQRNFFIESEGLLIRPVNIGDYDMLLKLFADDEMMHYLGGPWNAEQVIDAMLEWQQTWGVDQSWYGTLIRKDTEQTIGTAGFSKDSVENEPGLELSWFILPDQQGQGFAVEITHALLVFGFQTLKVSRVLAETHPDNPASNRVLEKAGFTKLGERHHTYDYLPDFNVQVLWEITAKQWTHRV